MIAHRQIRSQARGDFVIVNRAVEISGRASRLPAIKVRLRIFRIDANRAVVFSDGSDDVVATETLDALLNVFFCGLSALGC